MPALCQYRMAEVGCKQMQQMEKLTLQIKSLIVILN